MSNKLPKYSAEQIKELVAKKMEQIAAERGTSSPPPEVPLNFSLEVREHLTRAESDPASAMKLLEMLANDLRARTLPNRMLADFVADAIELAAAKPTAYQTRALTDELHLTSQDRRPAHAWLEVGRAMHILISHDISQNNAKAAAAAEFDIDETTALNYYKKYVAAKQAHDSIE